MSNLIDRQQAIEAICMETCGVSLKNERCMVHCTEVQAVEKLPPAEPMVDIRDTQYNLPVGTDCISRQALLDKFEPWLKVKDYNDGELNMLKAVLYEIRFMPPTQPEPKKGKWIRLDMHRGMADHKCSVCKQECYVPTCMGEPLYAFCPNCGSYNGGEQDE